MISSPSYSMKIQIMDRKVCLRRKKANIAGHWRQTFCIQKHPAMFVLYTFPNHNLNFQWRWWHRIRAIFLNLFYFTDVLCVANREFFKNSRIIPRSSNFFYIFFKQKLAGSSQFGTVWENGRTTDVADREFFKNSRIIRWSSNFFFFFFQMEIGRFPTVWHFLRKRMYCAWLTAKVAG